MSSLPHSTDELDVALLRRLADSPQASQRELARDTGVSLGRINYALRALIDKGWVKAGNFRRSANKLGYVYLLTPAGIDARVRLTRAFLRRKMDEYQRLRDEIARLQRELDAAPATLRVTVPSAGSGAGAEDERRQGAATRKDGGEWA